MADIKVYLAGACKSVSEEDSKLWRKEARTKLETIAEWCGKTIKVIDPLEYFNYDVTKTANQKQIKEYYMSRIKECNFILVNCKHTNLSPGTAQECQFAVDHGVPVIGFGLEDSYSWITDVDCQVVFDTITEALDYARDYYIK